MKRRSIKLNGAFASMFLVGILSAAVHADEEDLPASIGPGKAIEAANEREGFKLSEKAIRRIGLKLAPVESAGRVTIPETSLVRSQNEVGVYRVRSGWIKRVELSSGSIKISGTVANVFSVELKADDKVITEPVGIIRASELEAFNGADEGHGH